MCTGLRRRLPSSAPAAPRGAILFLACASLLIASCAAFAAPNRPIDPRSLTDAKIQKAIDALVAELYARRDPQRFWEPEKIPPGDSIRQRGGYTAITVLALLHAGQSYQDPRLRDAVDYLASYGMEGTYAVSIRTAVWARLPAKFKDKLAADTQWLLDGFSERVGGWDYDQNPTTSRKDNSIRQFGALGLWESAKRGGKIERRYWQRLEDAFLELQLADGGWNYNGEGPATGSMTAAGLATLFITQDYLHAAEAMKTTGGKDKPGRHETALERGLQWMDAHFSATENPGRDTHLYYYLYGVERVGLASGYRAFGGHDWYREGAAELLRRLCTWHDDTETWTVNATTANDGRGSRIRTEDLAFGLMFLSRGRVPIAVNKLRFDGAWNGRPRDVANLASFIRESSETDLNWQIVDIADDPATWLDAPMLYIASPEALPWMKGVAVNVDDFVRQSREFNKRRAAGEDASAATTQTAPAASAFPGIPQLGAIKTYLDSGGMILAVNVGGGKAFAESVENMGRLLYPRYDWKAAPDDHFAYSIHASLKVKPALRVLSNGVRDLIVLAPAGDLSKSLQGNDVKQSTPFSLATNLYFQASEMNRPRPRLAQHASGTVPGSAKEADATAPSRSPNARRFTVARAIHEDNWNPEPMALALFRSWLAQSQPAIDLSIIDVRLVDIARHEPRPDLVIVQGIEPHAFTPAEIDAIRSFAASRGVILFETPGGRGGFAAAAQKTLEKAFGSTAASINAAPIVTGEGLQAQGGANLSRIDYRPFALQAFGSRETTPRMKGMTIGGPGTGGGASPQLLFSAEDLSQALLNQPSWGVSGYSCDAARNLLANIVRDAIVRRDGGAATRPTP